MYQTFAFTVTRMPVINDSDEDMSETERLLENPVLAADGNLRNHVPNNRGPTDRFEFLLFCFSNVLFRF